MVSGQLKDTEPRQFTNCSILELQEVRDQIRHLTRLEGFLQALSWGSAPSAAIILEAGLKVEAGHRQR